MHAVVIEWQDGTVDVNGPYDDKGAAITAARKIGKRILESQEHDPTLSYIDRDDGCTIHDVDNQIDVYARKMGRPFTDPIGDAQRAATEAIRKANDLTIEATTAKVRELYPDAGQYAIALNDEGAHDEACYVVEWIDLDDTQQRLTMGGDLVDHWDPIQEAVGNLWVDGPLSGVMGWIVKLREEDVIDPSTMNPTETSCRPGQCSRPAEEVETAGGVCESCGGLAQDHDSLG